MCYFGTDAKPSSLQRKYKVPENGNSQEMYLKGLRTNSTLVYCRSVYSSLFVMNEDFHY